MANIQARRNKAGEVVSYSIRVHKGRDPVTGKQLKPYTMTWKVPEGWGEKRAEKEALKQAAIFEKQCRDGLSLDNHQTFATPRLWSRRPPRRVCGCEDARESRDFRPSG